MAFGDEVVGYSAIELRNLLLRAGGTHPPYSKGRSLEVCLLLAGSPVLKKAATCLQRWAREVWDAMVSPRLGTIP